jgi:acetyl-CoA carboxylase, biotin carboxylase subunit
VKPPAHPLKKVLIANRGEIALRVIRACHARGIPTVAVYSDADRNGLHVRLADEAVHIGPSAPRESYLVHEKILEAARISGANAIHPGYGFLSENAAFAAKCRDAGIVFIGPPPEAIRAMGDKIQSRLRMKAAGVPVVPGEDAVNEDTLEEAATRVGFPLMLKASAGGGGKGIRIVRTMSELREAFERARAEAEKAFGDGTVFLERFVEGPHHVEVQVFGDHHGNIVHVFERECSVQRRHQKVVEESPSPFVTPDLRARMCEAAVAAARAVGYVNAGTVEFLVDARREFYFLEMNTRLQVEHPITELVTGIDLVAEQLRVAAGEPLSFRQKDIGQSGHAIEVRVCAEDPESGYLPSTGVIDGLLLPGGPHVRLDSCLFPGLEISPFYDSMLAKLCVWAPTRDEAAARMRQALAEMRISGLRTNLAFLARILRDPEFLSGAYDTGILGRMAVSAPDAETERLALITAAVLKHEYAESAKPVAAEGRTGGMDAWRSAFRFGGGR